MNFTKINVFLLEKNCQAEVVSGKFYAAESGGSELRTPAAH